MSRGSVTFATAHVTGGLLRASVPIIEPRGHLLRFDVEDGVPNPRRNLQSKFGAL